MAKISFIGLDKLQLALLTAQEKKLVRAVVQQNGTELTQKMKRYADFRCGYQTGTTKRSIQPYITNDGMTVTVSPGTEYAPYLEYGTRFMIAQPFVRPALNAQGPIFIRDLKKIME